MRCFLRQSIKGGRVCAFNQDYKSANVFDDILEIISEELDVKGIIYDIIEAYLIYKIKHYKTFGKEFKHQFKDQRIEDDEEKEKFINEKLSKLPIHQLIKQIKLDELLWDFDAVSLYPSAMWDENSIYPRIETGYAFTKDTNNELVKNFNTCSFNQGSAILKTEYYNPKNLIVRHLPVKEIEKKIEINRMRNEYNIDTLTSVDIQVIVKLMEK